jgi:hypothetical protein
MTLRQTTAEVRRSQPFLPRAAAVALLAMALATVVWVLAVPVAGIDLMVGAGATAHRGGARQRAAGQRPRRGGRRPHPVPAGAAAQVVLVWNVVAVVVLVLSLAGPAGAATSGAWLTLTCLHLVVGLAVILGLRRAAGRSTVTA